MNKSLISVIVPVYNTEAYLENCIQSIVNQTFANLEIILVDDGSTDHSSQICDQWAEKDSRIQVIHKPNGGLSSARNAGLRKASGQYIGFVDSDDYIEPSMYETLYDLLHGSTVKVSCCSICRIHKNGILVKNELSTNGILDIASALNAVFYGQADTSMCNKLFDRRVLKNDIFPEGETNEEFSILIPILVQAGGIACTSKSLYYYFKREDSITGQQCLQEYSSGLVHKNLGLIKKQLEEYALPCDRAYCYFAAYSAYACALVMEKKYSQLSKKLRKDYQIYRKIMLKYALSYLLSGKSQMKDKILYCLILTKLLRPLYRVFYKSHL